MLDFWSKLKKNITHELCSAIMCKTSLHTYHYIFYHALLLFRYVAQRYVFVFYVYFMLFFQSPLISFPLNEIWDKVKQGRGILFTFIWLWQVFGPWDKANGSFKCYCEILAIRRNIGLHDCNLQWQDWHSHNKYDVCVKGML